MAKRHNVERIYELSPMQQGMLFHSLYAPQTGMYIEQINLLLEGPFDSQLWRQAWQLWWTPLSRHKASQIKGVLFLGLPRMKNTPGKLPFLLFYLKYSSAGVRYSRA